MSTRPLIYAVNKKVVKKEVPMPTLGPDDVLVKVRAVAFNPTDFKHLDFGMAVNSGLGCDFAGDIAEVGSNVTHLKVGEAVAGMTYGGNDLSPEDGAFSTYVKSPAVCVFRFPKQLTITKDSKIPCGVPTTYEQAASLPVAVVTTALGIDGYARQNIAAKGSVSGFAVVYGAASSLGFVVAQVYRNMGYNVIAVASSKHKQMFSEVGISHVVDYHDKDWTEQVKKIGGDDIVAAFDAISFPETLEPVSKVVSQTKPAIVEYSLPMTTPPAAPANVTFHAPLAYHLLVLKKAFAGIEFTGQQRFLDERKTYYSHIEQLLTENALKSLPIEVVGDGIDAVEKGLEGIRQGVSGVKLVVRI